MGADESKQKNSNQTFTKEEVEKILEKQRKLYEKKHEDIAAKMTQKKNNTDTSKEHVGQYTSEQLYEILEKQRQLYDKTLETHSLIKATSSNGNNTERLERQRTPYSFSQNDLHIGVAQPTSTSLYPNLNSTSARNSVTATSNMNQRCSQAHEYTAGDTYNVNSATAATSNMYTASAPTYNATGATHRVNAATVTQNANNSTGAIPKNTRYRNHAQNGAGSELKCRTCAQVFTATVFQCRNGHSSCRKCREGNAPCGVCGLEISDVRNRALEVLIGEMKTRCPNSVDGCKLHISIAELEQHSKECPFRLLECPLGTLPHLCRWRGKLPQLSSHFDEMHPDNKKYKVDTENELFIRQQDSHVMQLVQMGPFIFLFQIKESASNGMIYMAVQLVGTGHSAEKWTYEIHMYNKRQPRRKYQYTHTCQSSGTPLEDVFDEARCAAIPTPYAKTFKNEGQILFKFFIKKACA